MVKETEANAWQLKMFQKTLKKKLRLKALKKHIDHLDPDDSCLLITCGDNNGAINYYLRKIGGKWTWADHEKKSIQEMSELLGEPVQHIQPDALPYPDNYFDCVISIDVHEHLFDPIPFTKELNRVTRSAGKVIITVPNGDETKFATRIKNFVGMTKEKYGHFREGLNVLELKNLMRHCRIEPVAATTFSKFFTEMLELCINFMYVMVLAKKSKTKVESGTIAPATKAQLKSVEKNYRMYAYIYPFFQIVSKLDILQFATSGYVVMVEGRKE
jgi:SAM-dependent methyltransferase